MVVRMVNSAGGKMYRKTSVHSSYTTNMLKKFKATREKYSLLKTSWTYQTRQFFENSTLHGVRYIDEEGRPFWEKFMWFCVTAIGGVVTLIIIVSLWEKFQTNPTITGLDTDFHNWDVPFPAVSLCPFRPANMTLLNNLVDTKTKSDPGTAQLYTELLIELTNISWANMRNFKKFKGAKGLPESNLKSLATGVHISCANTLHECVFKGYPYPCCTQEDSSSDETSFEGVLTEIGFCFTFNSRHTKLSLKNKDDSFKVKLIYETDEKWALAFVIEPTDEVPGPEFQVFIHSTDELPSVEVSPQHVWDRRIDRIMFSSKQTYTTDEARQLSIKQRRCIFEDEVSLKTDDIYTYSACMSQCRMIKAKELCQCLPFFYKQIDGFPYCGLKGLVCIAENIDAIMKYDDCQCELGCMNTVYEVEKLMDAGSTNNDDPLTVGFVSWPMVKYKREVLFGWVDLLVSFGGIAGLFLGFSLLSGVEVIYFFTMRACCMVYRNRQELKQLQEEYANVEKPPLDLSLTPKFMKSDTNLIQVGTHKVGPIPQAIKGDASDIYPRNPKENFPQPPFNLEFLN